VKSRGEGLHHRFGLHFQGFSENGEVVKTIRHVGAATLLRRGMHLPHEVPQHFFFPAFEYWVSSSPLHHFNEKGLFSSPKRW
jgi:hypothetical protein